MDKDEFYLWVKAVGIVLGIAAVFGLIVLAQIFFDLTVPILFGLFLFGLFVVMVRVMME